jgi:multidrug resistance protein, MATE family
MRAKILRLAWPTLVAQMAIMLNSVIDTVMTGRLSAIDQAAVGLGASIYVSVHLAFTGVILALSPVAAQHFGAKRYEEIGAEFRQTVLLALIMCIPASVLLLASSLWTTLANPPADVALITTKYLDAIALAMPANLLFRVYSALNNAISRPRMIMFINLLALLAKLPLNALLMYGASIEFAGQVWRIEAQGGAGCGMATCIIYWGMFLVGLVFLLTNPLYKPFALWKSFHFDWPRLSNLAKIGIPIGLSYMVEITAFTFITVFLARTGAVITASHQVVSNLVGVMYMIPLALATAVSTITAQSIGANSRDQTEQAIRQGFRIILTAALATCLVVLLLRAPLAKLYSQDPQVIALSMSLMLWIVVYHFFDATQTAMGFTLRAFKITTQPMLIYVLALWGIGLGLGYGLAFAFPQTWLAPAQSFWSAGIAANLCAACGLWAIGAKKVRAVIRQLGD